MAPLDVICIGIDYRVAVINKPKENFAFLHVYFSVSSKKYKSLSLYAGDVLLVTSTFLIVTVLSLFGTYFGMFQQQPGAGTKIRPKKRT